MSNMVDVNVGLHYFRTGHAQYKLVGSELFECNECHEQLPSGYEAYKPREKKKKGK